jgi:DNA-binding winged helix-turn-helix (wHTH) protein
VHVCWLRKKLGDDATHPRYLITVRGRGYRFATGTGIGMRTLSPAPGRAEPLREPKGQNSRQGPVSMV